MHMCSVNSVLYINSPHSEEMNVRDSTAGVNNLLDGQRLSPSRPRVAKRKSTAAEIKQGSNLLGLTVTHFNRVLAYAWYINPLGAGCTDDNSFEQSVAVRMVH